MPDAPSCGRMLLLELLSKSHMQAAAEYNNPQRLHNEAAGLRRALQDAELEMQRMTETHRRELEDAAKVSSHHVRPLATQ